VGKSSAAGDLQDSPGLLLPTSTAQIHLSAKQLAYITVQGATKLRQRLEGHVLILIL